MINALHTLTKEAIIGLVHERDAQLHAHRDQLAAQHNELTAQHTRITTQHDRLLTYEARVFDLEFQITQLQRLVFGAKRERFVSEVSASQLAITFDADREEVTREVEKVLHKVSYERKTPKKHEGRMALPSHLPVHESILEPEEDTTGMVRIGEEITDELEITPASMHVNRIIRPKYATPQAEDGSLRIAIAPMPVRVIDKCIAGVHLLTTITIDKHEYHMPIDRQLKRFSMLGVDLPPSTVESWQKLTAELLKPLHAAMRSEVRQAGYLQVDETSIAVQDRDKQGTTHKGFLWGYHAPLQKAVYFDYQKGRGQIHCRELLEDYTGYLQTDDYAAYHKHKERADVIGVACWAHARRNFEKALEHDRARASVAMQLIQQLYDVEREARDSNLTYEDRKELRLQKALPLLNTISKWMVRELPDVPPRSPMGKALRLCHTSVGPTHSLSL
ncbi:MAG: IS66 family transposase [bacterium]|nr:IS66 family transposase [bacterium]